MGEPSRSRQGGTTLKRFTATFAALLIAVLPLSGGRADHEDGLYELPAIAQWGKTHLNVLIVPPNHGQVFNGETGFLNGNDPRELTPFNSYLDAMEEAIGAWDEAITELGSPELRAAYRQDVYVLGRDTVPPAVLMEPDILVVTDEDEGPSLGTAIRAIPCIVRMSKSFLISFTYADMYNVTAQEFGHCLGLRHVGSQGGVDPTSEQKHPEHDVMNGFYPHDVGFGPTHHHCVSNLNVLALEYVFATPNGGLLPTSGGSRTMFMPVSAYGDTCVPPPPDWRHTADATGQTGPDPQPSPGGGGGSGAQPAPASEVTSPADGAAVKRTKLRAIKGRANATGDDLTLVEAAIARTTSKGCRWWDTYAETFIGGPCDEPLWNAAEGTSKWRLPLGATLPKGRYEVRSRAYSTAAEEPCCERGRNRIAFRLK